MFNNRYSMMNILTCVEYVLLVQIVYSWMRNVHGITILSIEIAKKMYYPMYLWAMFSGYREHLWWILSYPSK